MPQKLTYSIPKTDWNVNTPIGDADLNRIETNMQLMTPLGVPMPYFFNFLPHHHLWCDGKTIGDEPSGATARANADVFNLFEGLWNSIPNAQLPIQTSAGTAGTRGVSALADFNAHMRLPLPDLRGRTIIGLDSTGGTSANVVTDSNADVLGGYAGAENHTLSISEMPSHVHGIGYGSTGYFSNVEFTTTRPASNATISSTSTGGSSSHNNMQPWIACNYIIRY